MIRPTLIDLIPVELKRYPFIINLDEFSGSYNSVDDLSTNMNICINASDINVKVYNIITNKQK